MAKKKSRGWIIALIVIVVLAVAAAIVIPIVINGKAKTSLTEVEVKRGDLTLSVTASGNATSYNQKSVYATTSGTVKEINFSEGDSVTENRGVLKVGETLFSAPIDGVITTIATEKGKMVSAGELLFTVSDITSYDISVMINETKISSIFPDNTAEVSFNALPDKTFKAKVVSVARDGVVSGGATLFKVVLRLSSDNDLSVLRHNMTGEVKIITEKVENALLLPVLAISYEDDSPFVYVLNGNSYQKTFVTLGKSDGITVEILEGVEENEKVYYSADSTSRLEELMGMWGNR